MSAISDVARLAGVSKSTASRALTGRGHVSEETRRRVSDAAARSDIASPNAASLVTGRTKNVGIVIPFVNRWFFGEVLEGAERALLSAGYDLTLYNLATDGPSAIASSTSSLPASGSTRSSRSASTSPIARSP